MCPGESGEGNAPFYSPVGSSSRHNFHNQAKKNDPVRRIWIRLHLYLLMTLYLFIIDFLNLNHNTEKPFF